MKKLLALILSLGIIVNLAACSVVKDNVDKQIENNKETIENEDTIKKDNTIFESYESFLQDSVISETFSLQEEPENLSKLNSICDCNIKFSGDLKNGSLSLTINNEVHGHGWSTSESIASSKSSGVGIIASKTEGNSDSATASVSSSTTQALITCEECGFVKGNNFIYVKIPGKSHGHGWSWPTENKNQIKVSISEPEFSDIDNCKRSYLFSGNYDSGEFVIKLNGSLHSHCWSTSYSSSISNSITEQSNSTSRTEGTSASVGTTSQSWSEGVTSSSGVSESYGTSISGMTGVPPCSECGFRKYDNNYGDKIITFRCNETGECHTINFTTFHKIGEKVNCECGLTTYGNRKSGGYSFSSKYSSVGHGWATSVSHSIQSKVESAIDELNKIQQGLSESINSSTSSNTESQSFGESYSESKSNSISAANTECICRQESVMNGFIVKCPATNRYHVINY